ncbi:methyltransferase domain-containing protein [Desulfuromonas sp. KJ2020]|uniref:methyltransferase domain-containing protein n=1 Tax=Desulfuromonas sp. KJ2020 TaxID=2919173 RepID=UPI0020A79AB6|nr:methyltransferase domain-containing protein [Desulfuromonas sp. KJ2020]MCP3176733.1 methyltransferase domain-containing protein [Desulfuromonas sp. KJ2020]
MHHHRYWFEAEVARQVLTALDRGDARVEISADLNLSRATFTLQGDALVLDDDNLLQREDLQRIAGKKNRIFLLEGGELVVLESRDEGYYKLVPTAQAPLLEISGVKMHISKGINPFESAGQMAAQVVKKGDRVLDTCSGLGYAALAALRLGARQVVTVERSATVMALRRQNPWSQGLSAPGIQSVQADVGTYICEFGAASFEAVIHDPPRFSLAGELYGVEFYREIYRVLTRRGGLFHYTGNPQLVRRGSSFVDQAVQRLKKAGFTRVEKVPTLMGVRAWK